MVKTLCCGSEVIEDMLIANSFIERLIGYMFRRKPHHQAILFNPCNSIHTFFMKFNIDVLFVNEDMEIVCKIENLKPRKLAMPVKGAKLVIEGRAGLFYNFEIGDRIIIK